MPPSEELRTYRFAIPAEPVRHLRFDPADGEGVVRIGRFRLLTAEGFQLAGFGPECLIPMHSIVSLVPGNGETTVNMGADDPMLLVARSVHRETALAVGRHFVGPEQIATLALLTGALAGLALWSALRGLATSDRRTYWVFNGALLAVFGARLYWLSLYSHPLPYWDEWETDGINLLIPLRGGFLDWQALFIPQSEHRILVTRLLDLAGSLMNGEWDPRVGMTAGALLFSAFIALLCAGAMEAGLGWGLGVAIALIGLASLPFDVNNLFWGAQSQMYALVLLAGCVLAIAVTGAHDRLAWLGGLAAGLVSLFTMGSGFVAPGLAGGICLARSCLEAERRRHLRILGAMLVVVSIAGICLYREAPFQGPDYARTWRELGPALIARAAWPLPPLVGWAVVVWIPWGAVGLRVLLTRRASALDWLAIGLGAWAFANVLGLAYSRPRDLAPFDSKYYTAMSVAVAGSILSTGATVAHRGIRSVLSGTCLLASLAVLVGLWPVLQRGMEGSRRQFAERSASDALVRRYLEDGDPLPLRSAHPSQLPYWNGPELADLLSAPLLQPSLPAHLRAIASKHPGSKLVGPQTPGPLTVTVVSLMRLGLALSVAGLGILVIFGVSRLPRSMGRMAQTHE